MALSSGRLEIADPRASSREILAYRRVYEDADRTDTAHVFLNFSKREVPIDLRDLPRDVDLPLYSNLDDEPIVARGRHVLRPWEGVVALRS